MNDTIKIIRTDARPMLVSKADWPLISNAGDTQVHLEVRAKKGLMGRCIVYGSRASAYAEAEGDRCNQSGYLCTLDEAPGKIRAVGKALGAGESLIMACIGDLPPITDDETPADEAWVTGVCDELRNSPVEALVKKWFKDETELRQAAERLEAEQKVAWGLSEEAEDVTQQEQRALNEAARDLDKAIKTTLAHADTVAHHRQELQVASGLVDERDLAEERNIARIEANLAAYPNRRNAPSL